MQELNGRANVVHRKGNIIYGPKMNEEFSGGLGKLIWDACDKYGDKLCQISAETEEEETYSNFKSRATTLAMHLKNLGIGKGDVVLSCTPNTIDSSLPLAASLFLGAVSTSLDPSLSLRDCTHLIPLVNPKIIFTCLESVRLIEECLAIINQQPLVIVFEKCAGYKCLEECLVKNGEESNFTPEIMNIEDLAFLLFSSGTTGLPKSISLSHKAIYTGAFNFQSLVNFAERILHFTSFYWISGILMFVGPFMRGTTRVLINKFETADTLTKIAKYKIIGSFIASSHGYKLTNIKDIKAYDLSALKSIYFGGSPLSEEQLAKLQKLLPHVFMSIGYGMTEVSGFATGFFESEKELANSRPSSVGRPLFGSQVKIVDPDTEQLLGVNQPGEIRFKGPAAMLGYYKQDSSFAIDAEGYIKSGDIGYFDENCCIYVQNRIKDMFKYQYWHIVPTSIENIIQEHPGVQEVVIFGIPHKEDGNLPAAAIKLRSGYESTTADDINKFIMDKVSDRQRLRGGVYFVDNIPKTPTEKVIRKKVQEMILERLQNN